MAKEDKMESIEHATTAMSRVLGVGGGCVGRLPCPRLFTVYVKTEN